MNTIKADPLAKAIYMGDAGECVIKVSKGNIYEQTLSPGDQLRVAADLLGELKAQDKLLFGIRGNHGNRIDRETGVGWDELLCARIGIPYMGVSCLGDIVLHHTSTAKVGFSLYCHHGSSGSITPAGKMGASHKPEQLVLADVALTAHHHACGEAWPARHLAYTDPVHTRLRMKTMRMFVCGSAYDSRDGYAEEKQYPVLLPEHIMVKVKTRSGSEGLEVEIDHTTIRGFDDEYANNHLLEKWGVRK